MSERYLDRYGLCFADTRLHLHERCAEWEPLSRVHLNSKRFAKLMSDFHGEFDDGGCWLCGAKPTFNGSSTTFDCLPEAHHITGNGSRSDERTALALVCRRCHRDRVPNHAMWLPRILHQKWIFDGDQLDWLRLTMIVGRHLPLLEPPPAGQSCWPWAELKRKGA